MKVIKTPWRNEFLELVKNSKQKIRITSPFIKENICDDLLSAKYSTSELNIVTSFKLVNLFSGSLDINGLEKLINANAAVKNHSKLHSKIYIFDENQSIISSSNLTNGGLINNYEYGILIDDKRIVFKIIDDFELLFDNKDNGTITVKDLKSVKNILSKIPKTSKIHFPKYSIHESEESEVISTEIKNIADNLRGWKKEIFLLTDKIKKQIFTLDDIYSFEKELALVYPNNKNIKDKIRQQLQFLRDLSLIEFLGNGKYRKLWKQAE